MPVLKDTNWQKLQTAQNSCCHVMVTGHTTHTLHFQNFNNNNIFLSEQFFSYQVRPIRSTYMKLLHTAWLQLENPSSEDILHPSIPRKTTFPEQQLWYSRWCGRLNNYNHRLDPSISIFQLTTVR